jgi:sialate O-acetylesterase
MKRQFVLLGGALVICLQARADVKLPAVFGDNMILQRGVSAPIWGEAAPGEKVTVQIAGQRKETTAGADGKWSLKLDPLAVAENATLQVNGNNEIKINNVAVGEVWIASGQSNMEWSLRNTHDLQNALADSNDPQFRLFTVQKATSDKPLSDVKGSWQLSSPDTAPGFSAVGWYFGRELRKKLNVPVGVIHTSWGGTPAEAWTTLASMQADPDYQSQLDRWTKLINDYPAALEKYNTQTLPAWEEARKKARAEGKPEPQRPRGPEGPNSQNRPANLYNAMIAPIVPYSSRGAIWYQGESNAGRAFQYRKLLPLMISDWRRAWGAQKPQDFGFYIVQLANFMAEKPEPGDSAWAELREAQTLTANLPGNGQGLAIDIGEEKDIHPRNKRDVGLRLAAAALAQTYGQKSEYSGPVYAGMRRDGNKIRLRFKHANGLTIKAPPTSPDVPRGHWAFGAIETLGNATTYKVGLPLGNVTASRVEFASAILRLGKQMRGANSSTADFTAAFPERWDKYSRADLIGLYGALHHEFLPEIRKMVPELQNAVQGFAIAGEDKKWRWANAQIEGNEVVVWSEFVPNPVAVRYAWADNPKATLYNAEGFPAVPFRTDDWPGVTVNNK